MKIIYLRPFPRVEDGQSCPASDVLSPSQTPLPTVAVTKDSCGKLQWKLCTVMTTLPILFFLQHTAKLTASLSETQFKHPVVIIFLHKLFPSTEQQNSNEEKRNETQYKILYTDYIPRACFEVIVTTGNAIGRERSYSTLRGLLLH